MLYLIGPDELVNLSFENFQKMVRMTMVHVLRFAYLQFTGKADNVRFYHKESLKIRIPYKHLCPTFLIPQSFRINSHSMHLASGSSDL